jgi:hypothetical protein
MHLDKLTRADVAAELDKRYVMWLPAACDDGTAPPCAADARAGRDMDGKPVLYKCMAAWERAPRGDARAVDAAHAWVFDSVCRDMDADSSADAADCLAASISAACCLATARAANFSSRAAASSAAAATAAASRAAASSASTAGGDAGGSPPAFASAAESAAFSSRRSPLASVPERAAAACAVLRSRRSAFSSSFVSARGKEAPAA